MKRLFLAAASLCVFLSTGCAPIEGTAPNAAPSTTSNSETTEPTHALGAIVDWADVIRFEGITYMAASEAGGVGRPLRKEDLGPKFAEVKHRLQGNVDDPAYRTKNGDAGFLEAGTPVYEVKGYDPSFRLAAYDGKTLKLYEVVLNMRAEEVSDYLDIEGKVRYIGVYGDFDGTRKLGVIRDPEKVRYLVSTIMEASLQVEPGAMLDDGRVYFLAFHLEDGTATLQTYYADTGGMYLGISLPEKAQRAIERSVRGRDS